MSRHSILINYYKKYSSRGGYLGYVLEQELNEKGEDNIELTIEAAVFSITLKFPNWYILDSKDYKNLMNYFLNDNNGIEMVIRLITYWRYYTYIDPNISKYKRSETHKYTDLAVTKRDYELVCIAFYAEYKRLTKVYKDDISNYRNSSPTTEKLNKTILSKFHEEEYWQALELFISVWICARFEEPRNKDQEWRKDGSAVNYGINILKIYSSFIDSDRTLLPKNIVKWIKLYELDTIKKCGDLNKHGGYLDFNLPLNIDDSGTSGLEFVIEQREEEFNTNYPDWQNINSKRNTNYNNLINYLSDDHSGNIFVYHVLTYWRFKKDPNKDEYTVTIYNKNQFMIACIAFSVELMRLMNKHDEDITNFNRSRNSQELEKFHNEEELEEFHNEEFWTILESFISYYACYNFTEPGEKIGYKILKEYIPQIDKEKRLLPQKIINLISQYEPDTLIKCKNIRGGNKINTFYNKYVKYNSRIKKY